MSGVRELYGHRLSTAPRGLAGAKQLAESIARRLQTDYGGSYAWKVLLHVAKVAPTDSTVLITGETGTGKEVVARAIHRRLRRSTRAFVRVNRAAIPSSLTVSELFGHEKGAFTGATGPRRGRFEMADGGTISLDEVGELSAEAQVACCAFCKSVNSSGSVAAGLSASTSR
jgi:transcriptional regulator with GAF, ATPase, and Fis domain